MEIMEAVQKSYLDTYKTQQASKSLFNTNLIPAGLLAHPPRVSFTGPSRDVLQGNDI